MISTEVSCKNHTGYLLWEGTDRSSRREHQLSHLAAYEALQCQNGVLAVKKAIVSRQRTRPCLYLHPGARGPRGTPVTFEQAAGSVWTLHQQLRGRTKACFCTRVPLWPHLLQVQTSKHVPQPGSPVPTGSFYSPQFALTD